MPLAGRAAAAPAAPALPLPPELVLELLAADWPRAASEWVAELVRLPLAPAALPRRDPALCADPEGRAFMRVSACKQHRVPV